MTLRVPPRADQTIQTMVQETERRLRRLEQRLGTRSEGATTIIRTVGGSSSVSMADLTAINERISALEQTVADFISDSGVDVPVFGGVGLTSRRGLVPEPGVRTPPTGLASHVLVEDATWGYPFRGLIRVATSGEQTEPPFDVLNVHAGLTSLALTTGDLQCIDMRSQELYTGSMVVASGGDAASYTVGDGDSHLDMDASSGAVTVTLPEAASSRGRVLFVKKTDSSSNAVTIDGNGSETVDGATTQDLFLQYECLQVICDGTGWAIV